MLKSSDMGGSWLMHSPTRLANGKSDVRATGDRHVNNSAINGRILVTNVMIDRSPLLLVNVRRVEVLLYDGSISLNILRIFKIEWSSNNFSILDLTSMAKTPESRS